MRDLQTFDALEVQACTEGGVTHDWRRYDFTQFAKPHTSWRCVWCHAVTCGDYDQPDPCWLPYHHRGDHRSRAGIVWPLGGDRASEAGKQ